MATIEILTMGFWPVTPSSIIAVGAVLPIVASTAVGLRFYVKVQRKSVIGLDDWLILFALILCIGLGITMIVGSALNALGQPTPLGDGPLGFFHVINDAIVTTEKIKYAFNIIQALAFGMIKLSVLCFYRNIFRGRWFNIASWIMIAITIVWTVGFLCTYIFECRLNFWAFWSTLADLLTYCLDDVLFQKVLAITDVITDFLILSIPIPCVWKLQLSTERKLGVCGIFLMGSLVVAFGIVRLVIFEQRLADGFSSSQGILLMSTWFYWSMIEMGMAILAACLPSLRPLLGRMGSLGSLSKALLSIFTLRSQSSSGSAPENTQENKLSLAGEGASTSSQTEFANPTHPVVQHSGDSFAMIDIEAQIGLEPGELTFMKNFSQTYSKY